MKRKGLLVYLVFMGLFLFPQFIKAQQNGFDPGDKAVEQKYAHYNFNGKFAVKAESDETNNYYLVDFSRFQDKFERITFMEMVFRDDNIAAMNSDLSKDCLWFSAHRNRPEKDILILFNDYREATVKKASTLSEKDKSEWLKENDKYK